MSESDKHIKKSIKDSFDRVHRKAPENLWSMISQVTNLTKDEFNIHESFNNQTKTAPSETWSNVKKQLIIDEVWDKIVAYEDRRKRKVIYWYIASISTILIFTLSLLVINSNKNTSELRKNKNGFDHSKNSDTLNQNNSNVSELDRNEVLLKNIEIKNNIEINLIPSTLEKTNNNKYAQINDDDTIRSEYHMIIFNANMDSGNSETVSIDKIPIKKPQLLDFKRPNDIVKTTFDSVYKPQIKRFEVGFITSFGNSWLFNNDVKNGLNSKSLIKNNLSTGYSIGSIIGYNFNKKSGVELGYDFYSVHKQGYDFYYQGRLVDNDIRLKQQKASLVYKFRFNDNDNNKRNFLIKTGLFFAHSTKERLLMDGIENNSNSSFDTFNYGLNLGAGIEHNLSKFKFEYGVKTEIGFHNITANTVNLPKKFDYATTYILAGYVSVRYLF
jgi:hypothetical protein